MNKQEKSIGLIGLGSIGKVHAACYNMIRNDIQDVPFFPKITAILRSKPGSDEAFLKQIGQPKIIADPEEFFENKYDMVDICTPNFLHFSNVQNCIKNQKSIYCEKPLACSLDQARTITRLVKEAGIQTHTAFIFRYFPIIQKCKELLSSDSIGKPFHFRFSMFTSSHIEPKKIMTWRHKKNESGGGVLADHGIHMIDLIHYLLGEVSWVQCETQTYIKERPIDKDGKKYGEVDADDWALCTIGLENGAIGSVEVSRVAADRTRGFTIDVFGSEGSIKLDLENPSKINLYHQTSNEIQEMDVSNKNTNIENAFLWKKSNSIQDYFQAAHIASILDFMTCIKVNKPSKLRFENALKAQEVLDSAYRSAENDGEKLSVNYIEIR